MGIINSIKTNVIAAYDSVMTGRASKGTIRDSYYSRSGRADSQSGQASPTNLNLVLEHFRLDPVVQTALTTRADAILASGWTNKGSVKQVKNADTRLKAYGFDYNYVYQTVINALLYEHIFLEVERTNAGSPTQVHILETPYMEIKSDKHGDIEGFVEQGETGEPIFFPTKDVVFGKFNPVTTAVWGEVGLKSIYRTLGTKNQTEKFINSLAVMNAWRQVFKTTMTDENIEEFLSYYMDASADPTQPLVMQIQKNLGTDFKEDNTFEVLRNPEDLKEFLSTLDYFRTQALMFLKVPPILVGLPGESNRSNSDSQFKAYNIANESTRKKLKIYFDELYSKLGLGNVEFDWNPIDERSEKDDVEIAEKLMNMGAKPKQVEQFLRDTGLELPEGELFDKKIDPVTSDDQFPSRQGKADGEGNEKIGTGADSTTRVDQL